ncbi:unnamed protein product [Clavelina lepadiformis]|uniref:Uncharacterized protein n=1 Tax=Clavelina lepadiformis TaxID=159417 RepID=A0ABP0FUX8_CLALP
MVQESQHWSASQHDHIIVSQSNCCSEHGMNSCLLARLLQTACLFTKMSILVFVLYYKILLMNKTKINISHLQGCALDAVDWQNKWNEKHLECTKLKLCNDFPQS